MTLVQWATHSNNVVCKAANKCLVEFQEYRALQTQAEQLHSADKAPNYDLYALVMVAICDER